MEHLAASHREYLEARAVDPEQFNGRFRSVEGNDPALVDFAPTHKRSGLLITTESGQVQLRPDSIPRGAGKFICAAGQPPIIDIPAQIAQGAAIAVVEGLVKSSSVSLAWPEGVAVGIIGCSTWAVSGTRYGTLRQELASIEWDGRTCFIIFDADWKTNPEVGRALKALGNHLLKRGALVYAVSVPVLEGDSSTGVDDWLASHPPAERQAALAGLLDDAEKLKAHGGRRKSSGRREKNADRPNAAVELSGACVASGDFIGMDGQTAHYERNVGLWTPLGRAGVSEVACSPEYLNKAKLEPTSGIHKYVPYCIEGKLERQPTAPAPARSLWPFASFVVDVSTASLDGHGCLEYETVEYARDHFFTGKLSYDPAEEWDGEAPKLWRLFLATALGGDEEMVDYAERVAAYIMFGDNHWQKFLYLFGLPESGKGVFISVITSLMGAEHVKALNESLVWDDKPWALLPLLRSRLVVVSCLLYTSPSPRDS